MDLDLSASTDNEILLEVEGLLIRNGLTGLSGDLNQGAANTDSLMIFYEGANKGTTQDAVIIRYQEGATSEPNYFITEGPATPDTDELSVVAVFQDVTDFVDANIV